MAYVDTFENDIFLSYARVDNLTATEGAKGWVELFKDQLEVRLSKRVGRIGEIKIWWDTRSLHGNQPIDNTIKEAIAGSAVFVALNSNGYIHPESYCIQEVEWFHEFAGKSSFGIELDNHSRLFNVKIQNIHHTKWLEPMKGTLGFLMHDTAISEDIGEPLEPGSKKFNECLRDLVNALFETLTHIKEHGITIPDKKSRDPENKAKFFIAEVSDSLRKVRKRIIHQLKKAGQEIICTIPPPYEEKEHEEAVLKTLNSTILSVHLFDQFPGKQINGEKEITYSQKQLELARKAKVPHYIWMAEDLDINSIDDDYHKNFLSTLENNEPENADYALVRSIETSITREILVKLKQVTKSSSKEKITEPSVLLDFHNKDMQSALEVAAYLIKIGCQPHLVDETDNPKKDLASFEEKLELANILIIFYGSVIEEWVKHRIGVALHFAAKNFRKTENFGLQALGIYLAPPIDREKLSNFDLPGYFNVQILNKNHSPTFNPQTLTPLFSTTGWKV